MVLFSSRRVHNVHDNNVVMIILFSTGNGLYYYITYVFRWKRVVLLYFLIAYVRIELYIKFFVKFNTREYFIMEVFYRKRIFRDAFSAILLSDSLGGRGILAF